MSVFRATSTDPALAQDDPAATVADSLALLDEGERFVPGYAEGVSEQERRWWRCLPAEHVTTSEVDW